MNDLEQLYQRLSEMNYKDMYEIEADFFMELYRDFSETRLPWMTAFLTISAWFGTSMRSGVWTFYEAGDIKEMEMTVSYLRTDGKQELADIFEKGIHDYQNPEYAKNYDYPEEWLEGAAEIDDWIAEHEDYLWKWEYDILIMNKDSIMNR